MPKYTYLTPEAAKAHMLGGGQCCYLDGGIVIYDTDQQRFKYRDQENGWADTFEYLEKVECSKQVALKARSMAVTLTPERTVMSDYTYIYRDAHGRLHTATNPGFIAKHPECRAILTSLLPASFETWGALLSVLNYEHPAPPVALAFVELTALSEIYY